ncbi:hypothetical protein ACKWTF_000926 [Chironomus riparius]
MSDLAMQNNTTSKRPRQMLNPDHENQQNNEIISKKRPKVKRNNSTSSVDLCQRISKAIENILILTKNEEFRKSCFQLLGVENSSDAGTKIKELAESLKGKKQQQQQHKGDKKRAPLKRKINENPNQTDGPRTQKQAREKQKNNKKKHENETKNP